MTSPANDNQRLLSRAEAAAYCGYSPEHFSRLVLKGVFPPSLPLVRRWDKTVLDKRLDEMSGLVTSKPSTPEDDYDTWERQFREGKSKRSGQGPQKARGR